jgi:hypothetical protein
MIHNSPVLTPPKRRAVQALNRRKSAGENRHFLIATTPTVAKSQLIENKCSSAFLIATKFHRIQTVSGGERSIAEQIEKGRRPEEKEPARRRRYKREGRKMQGGSETRPYGRELPRSCLVAGVLVG